MVRLPKLVIILGICLLAQACKMKASIESLDPKSVVNFRADPDLQNGQEVTTSNGVVIKATFGEISEKKTLANGVVFEGAFYE